MIGFPLQQTQMKGIKSQSLLMKAQFTQPGLPLQAVSLEMTFSAMDHNWQ